MDPPLGIIDQDQFFSLSKLVYIYGTNLLLICKIYTYV